MKVHVPPVVVAGLAFAAQRWVAPRRPSRLRRAAAVVTASAAAGFGVSGVLAFAKHGTTVDPLDPSRASTLVADGPYSVSRNPMYVALVGALGAHALWRGNALAGAPILAAWIALDRRQIGPEEGALAVLFGDEYVRYCDRVPRWIGWPQGSKGTPRAPS